MPELPEVETIARGLQMRVAGDVIESVWIGEKSNLLKSPAEEISRTLEGARIERVRRVGKHMVVSLIRSGKVGERAEWVIHLGMTGRVLLCDPATDRARHTHLVAQLASGRELRFVDPRRFGKLQVMAGEPFRAAGSEPIGIGREDFAKLFRKRQTPIKSALLNQKLLSGIGNIYADESLFRAGISPRRRAASLSRQRLARLYDALQQVLAEAIAAGGSSISDYVDATGESGMFQFQHRVYGREGEPCLACKRLVQRVVIAGRSSHYCPKCQR